MKNTKTSILILGEDHRDPATAELIDEVSIRCHALKIPLLICTEGALYKNKNAEVVRARLASQGDKEGKKILHIPGLSRSLYKDINGQIATITANESDLNTFKKALSFGHSLIGIDDLESSLKIDSGSSIDECEKPRIDSFVKSIIEAKKEIFKGKSGIIIVQCGLAHSQRLAVQLKTRLSNDLDRYIITPLKVESDYLRFMEGNIDPIRLLIKTTMAEYDHKNKFKNVTSLVECKDVKELKDGSMRSKTFTGLLKKAIELVGVREFHIPNLDKEKQAFVEKAGGEVVSTDLIRILSNILTKDLRDKLGVSRHLITLKHPESQLPIISKVANVTLEIESSEKILVTYPNDAKIFFGVILRITDKLFDSLSLL